MERFLHTQHRKGKNSIFYIRWKQKQTHFRCVCVYMYSSKESRSITTQWSGGRTGAGLTNPTSCDTILYVLVVLLPSEMLICLLGRLMNGIRNLITLEHSPV